MPANPDAGFQQGGSGQTGQAATQGDLGLTLAPLTPDLRSELNLPGNAAGAVVMAVKPNSLADQAGLQQGDLLVGVGPQNVTSPSDVAADVEAARKSGAKAVALRIIRQGQALFVGIALNKSSGASQN